jgi:hypothetical protein
VQTETNTSGGQVRTDSAESAASGQISATSLPLDTVTSAVLAFSTARKLRTAYTGDAIRVRRSSDNAEQDIGFDGSGNLDESALTTFVGANDGYVVTVYEQSGDASAVDFVQSTAALQPQIVVSGVVVKQNGKPAMQQPTSGSGHEFVVLNTWGTRPASASLLKVARYRSGVKSVVASTVGASPYLGAMEASGGGGVSVGSGTGQVWRADGSDIGTEGAGLSRQDLYNALADDALHTLSARGVDFASSGGWAGLRTEYSNLTTFDGAEFIGEMIVITDDAERANIETSMSNFYGTP